MEIERRRNRRFLPIKILHCIQNGTTKVVRKKLNELSSSEIKNLMPKFQQILKEKLIKGKQLFYP